MKGNFHYSYIRLVDYGRYINTIDIILCTVSNMAANNNIAAVLAMELLEEILEGLDDTIPYVPYDLKGPLGSDYGSDDDHELDLTIPFGE